jgi:GNAT superfamily N-acetyltransferase
MVKISGYTSAELEEMLDLTKQRVYQIAQKEGWDYVWVGRVKVYDRAQVEAYRVVRKAQDAWRKLGFSYNVWGSPELRDPDVFEKLACPQCDGDAYRAGGQYAEKGAACSQCDWTSGPEWTVQADPDSADRAELRRQLQAHNVASSNIADSQELGIFLRDDAGELVAGASGWMWGACLEIDLVWVHPDLRGQGVGKRLLLTLETAARARGCREVSLNTFSFQAPEFYQKLGYEVLATIGNFGDGNKKFYMRKWL